MPMAELTPVGTGGKSPDSRNPTTSDQAQPATGSRIETEEGRSVASNQKRGRTAGDLVSSDDAGRIHDPGRIEDHEQKRTRLGEQTATVQQVTQADGVVNSTVASSSRNVIPEDAILRSVGGFYDI